ncbi:hypothetical protein WN944_003976 [Citrus x changshan-huyou]|uniref:Uncharacterized protein n=1 Tax=Citrus x changshan-huyou TaxID=2935761 RepID=A0AAP0M485_9ROSI
MATVKVVIARMIVLHELLLSFVEYIEFYKLLKLLQHSIETLSRNPIKTEILKLYDIKKTKAMSIWKTCDSRIAVTTDMWTASNKKKWYMVVTAHYIDSPWVLRSCIMRFIYVPAPHSGEVMCNELYECLMERNIDRKLSTIIVDNCSANDSMIDLLLGKFSTSSMERDRNYTSLPSELEWNFSKLMSEDSIMLDLDEMADEWESFRNQNSQNNHFKTELELYLEESILPSTSQFDIGGRIIKANISYLQRLRETFWSFPGGLVCTQNWFWLDQNLKDGIPEEAILAAKQLVDESLMGEL